MARHESGIASGALPLFRAAKFYDGYTSLGSPRSVRPDIRLRFYADRAQVTVPGAASSGPFARPLLYEAAPLGTVELASAAILMPKGFVFTSRGELLRESVERLAFRDDLQNAHPELLSQLADATEHRHPREVCVLATQRMANYCHWWLDAVPRLWLLERSPHAGGRLVVPPLGHGFHRRSLELLRVADRLHELAARVARFPTVVFASGIAPGSSQAVSPAAGEFAAWLRARLGIGDAVGKRRLVVLRRRARSRRLVNEAQLVEALPADFEPVELETLDLEDQIRLFAEADTVVGPHGAGMMNLIFAPPAASLIELVPAADPPSVYRSLSFHFGHAYESVLGVQHPAGRHRIAMNSDFSVDVDEVCATVARLGGG